MSMLDRIVAEKREEASRLGARRAELRRAAESAAAARPFGTSLRRGGEVALIAEVKRRSPSAGWIRAGASVVEVAEAYAGAGAAAVSVLTDAAHFGGSLADLSAVRAAVELPVLRKDFVVDAVQVWEARAAGADAVLLIVRILGDDALRDLLAAAESVGLAALVEVHDGRELERALSCGATIVGTNSRDLATFRTDLSVALGLAAGVAPGVTLVAESGVRGAADVDRLGAAGFDAVLVGETLMRAEDVGTAAAALVGRPRRQRSGGAGGSAPEGPPLSDLAAPGRESGAARRVPADASRPLES